MKILIVGAGVLGSLATFRLQRGGHQVRLLARGDRLVDLRQNGLRLEDAVTGERVSAPVEVLDRLDPHEEYDLTAVIMGRHQVAAVLPALAACQRMPNVLFIGNNVTGAAEYGAAIGPHRVLLGFLGAAGYLRQGLVHYGAGDARRRSSLTLGEPDGSRSSRAQDIAAAFEAAGFAGMISPDIDAWLKTHVAVVLPLAGGVYRCGDVEKLAQDDGTLRLVAQSWKDALAVLRRRRIAVLPGALRAYGWMPARLLASLCRKILRAPYAYLSFSHAQTARAEMHLLAEHYLALADEAGAGVPALRQLLAGI